MPAFPTNRRMTGNVLRSICDMCSSGARGAHLIDTFGCKVNNIFTKKCISYINIVHVELFPLHKSSNMSFMLILFSKNARNSYTLSPYPDKSSEIGILDDAPSRKVVLVV